MGRPLVIHGRVHPQENVAEWSAHVVPAKSTWLRRPGYRYELWRRWASWMKEGRSRWYPTAEECRDAAVAKLRRIEKMAGPVGVPVVETDTEVEHPVEPDAPGGGA